MLLNNSLRSITVEGLHKTKEFIHSGSHSKTSSKNLREILKGTTSM